jgi:protein-disulfide isomerase
MEKDEGRTDNDPQDEGGGEGEHGRSARKGSQAKTAGRGARGSSSGRPPHIVWAVVSALVLVVFAPGLFAAGFFTNELTSDDDGGTAALASPTPASPTPAPVVAASADDDPFIGPEDAPVTIIEFSDYQ